MSSNLSRRQILSLLQVVGMGTVVTANIPLLGNLFASKAQAQNIYNHVYKGRKYRIQTDQNQESNMSRNLRFARSEQLFIDDRQIQIVRMNNGKKYMTPLLFGAYDSPQEVAKILIDLKIKFPSGEVQLDPDID